MKRLLTILAAAVLSATAYAATPTVTVTLTDYTSDYSGADYVVRLSPLTGGIAKRELTDASSVATFTAVTPADYMLTIENVGVQSVVVRVPSSSDTLASTGLIVSDWDEPGPSTSTASPWFRGVPYLWPSDQGAANTALANDGSGGLSWALYMPPSANLTNWSAIATTTKQAALGQTVSITVSNLTAAGSATITNNASVGGYLALSGTNRITIATNGVPQVNATNSVILASSVNAQQFTFDTSLHLKSGAVVTNLVGGSGTAANPDFSTDPGTGMFKSATNVIGFATGGTEQWVINQSGSLVPVGSNSIGNGAADPVYVHAGTAFRFGTLFGITTVVTNMVPGVVTNRLSYGGGILLTNEVISW